MSIRPQSIIKGLVLVLVTVSVYVPAMRSGFIWDDDAFLYQNRLIHAADGLQKFWFTTQPPDYFPLTSTTLWFEWRLWGSDHPEGYHAVNVLLHAISTFLLWRILVTLRIPGAWLAALIFGIHPVNVESVAWITQRKNTLSMSLALGACLLYLRDGASRKEEDIQNADRRSLFNISYIFSLVLFLLALLSKTSVAPVPAALLILGWWKDGRITSVHVRRAAPFFVLAGVLALVTIYYQSTRAISDIPIRTDGFLSRFAIAGMAVWFYLFKSLVPLDLRFVYPKWEIDPSLPLVYLPVLILLVLLCVLWIPRNSAIRSIWCALAIYVLMLLPVIGFFDIYFMSYSLVSDHWQYAAIPAVITLVVSCCVVGYSRLDPNARALRGGIATSFTAVVIALCVLSWRQQAIYRDVETLWRLTLDKDPNCWLAHNNLGARYLNRGRHDDALRHLHRTIELKHDHCAAHTNIGIVMMARKQYDEAYRYMSRAVELCPDWPTGLANLASLLIKLKRYDAAKQHLIESMEKDPGRVSAHYDLGVVHYLEEAFAKATFHLEKVITSQPRNAEAIYALGMAYLKSGQSAEGQPYLADALILAEEQGNAELASRIDKDLKRQEQGPEGEKSEVAR